MSDELTTYQKLAAPFAVADHAKVNNQTYAPWTAYVERLNDVLKENWSFRVIREGFTETECWVLGEITATIEGVVVTRQQYGCESILKGSRPVADLLKTATSDAVKKATSLLGPGLYLSIKDEREAMEAEMRAAVQAEAQRQADERKAEAEKKLAGRVKTEPTPPQPINMLRCRGCGDDVPKDGTVTILKKKEGPKVEVTVADFEPVCKDRLGEFHCGACFDRKYWGAA